MDAGTLLPLIAAPACVIYLIMVRRSITTMRAGDEEWRQRWRQLDPTRREAIRDCMKRGDPVRDHGDAELSLRAVRQIEHVRKAMAPVTLVSLLAVVAFLAAGVVSGSTFLSVIGAFGLVASGVFDVISRRQRHRYEKSSAATRRLHGMDLR